MAYLDHGARQAEIVAKMLADAGSKTPLAAMFPGRADGVEGFLREVEGSDVA